MNAQHAEESARQAKRQALRQLSLSPVEGPAPAGVSVFAWAMTALGLAAAAASLAFFIFSLAQLSRQAPLAGEDVFSGGVALCLAAFVTWVWNGFRTLPDWRVGLDVPLRVKVFGAAGSAFSASFAAGSAALFVFAICSKDTFSRLMERFGAAGIGKVQVLASAAALLFLFLLLWYLFQGVMELRNRMRVSLAAVLGAAAVLSAAGLLIDAFLLAPVLGNRGVTALSSCVGALAVIALILLRLMAGGEAASRCFRTCEL